MSGETEKYLSTLIKLNFFEINGDSVFDSGKHGMINQLQGAYGFECNHLSGQHSK